MPVLVDTVLGRLAALKKVRQPYEAVWKDITDYVLPRRSFWDLDITPGQKPSKKLYDGTAITELQLLVDGTLGNLVSANLRWLRLTMEDRRQNEIPWVKDWLEEVEDALYAEFARSNFYDSMGEFFLDAASIGTAVMLIDEDLAEKNMLFSTRHMKECYVAEGRNGKVDTLYREFTMTNRQIGMSWGIEKLAEGRKQQLRTNPFGRGTVVHACYPRGERDPGKVDQSNKQWASVYIDKDFHAGKVLDEGGYDMFPYLCWRWRKNSDEIYGRSPAIDAIQDVLRLNQIGKTALEVAQLAAMPPLNVPLVMKGHEKIIPRGYNYYTKADEIISPIQMGQNYSVTKDQEAELKEQIRQTFRTKIYMIMEQLQSGGPYTATEVNARQSEKATVQGPMMGRLSSEVLIPLIKRTFVTSEQNGVLPPPPPGLGQGGRIHIEFQGPLALQMKRFHQAQGVDASLAFIQQMAQFFPESLDNVDGDELMRSGMDSKGAPQKGLRELPERKKIREMRAEEQKRQEQQAIEMQQQEMLAKNAGQLNEPVKQGSMLEGIGKAAAQQGSPAAPTPRR
jgi:hypothetical protein